MCSKINNDDSNCKRRLPVLALNFRARTSRGRLEKSIEFIGFQRELHVLLLCVFEVGLD